MKVLKTPLSLSDIKDLKVGDIIRIEGDIFTGRDSVLPKIVKLGLEDKLSELNIDLSGSVIFHTAVSDAGIGPTSSNKLEIENSFVPLSKLGVRIHLGKGAISQKTVQSLMDNDSVFAVIPPVSALLGSQILNKEVLAFPELGMEAFHKLEIEGFTAIIAAAKGKSLY